jgi:hypothetical protein
MHGDWTARHFSQANPAGPDQADVPALLRRIAGTIEDLGEVEILDLVLHQEISPRRRLAFDHGLLRACALTACLTVSCFAPETAPITLAPARRANRKDRRAVDELGLAVSSRDHRDTLGWPT